MGGSELCQLSHKQVKEKISSENFETFYTHLEMLRKHRYVAVLDENEKEESNSALKRNQKPSKFDLGVWSLRIFNQILVHG